jgi:hypothetical protein
VHCSTIGEYRSHCKRQRCITFQPYIAHSALYMRDGASSGVSVVNGLPSITLEFADNPSLETVAKVSRLQLCVNS